MKKLALLVACAAIVTFVACDNKAKKEAEKKLQDSLEQVRINDSITKVEDSLNAIRLADSLKAAQIADSLKALETKKK